MKTNQRRKTPQNQSFDYSHNEYQRRWKRGLQMDHDGGRRGSAKDVREQKKIESRKRRCKEKQICFIDIEVDR